jgi:hypothetical protein
MFRLITAFALAPACALTLSAAPARAQTPVTVRYAWLSPAPADGARPRDDVMLMLACPRGDGGPAFLSLAQPAVTGSGATHLLESFEGAGRALFQDPFPEPDAQAVLTQIRSALARNVDTTFSGAGGKAVHLIPLRGVDTVAVPPELLATFGKGVRLAGTCTRGVPDVLHGTGPRGELLLQAGEYVFAARQGGAAPPSRVERLENAMVTFFSRVLPRDDGDVTVMQCTAAPPSLRQPLAGPEALQARRALVEVTEENQAGGWVIRNGGLADTVLTLRAEAPRLEDEGFRPGKIEESVTVPACGELAVVVQRAEAAAQDSLRAEIHGGTLVLTLMPAVAQGQAATRRVTVVKSDAGLLVDVAAGGGGGRGVLLWIVALTVVVAVGTAAVVVLRRSRRPIGFEDDPRFFRPGEIQNPFELALHLQELPRRPLPQLLKELKDAIPQSETRRLSKFHIGESDWRPVLWTQLHDSPRAILKRRLPVPSRHKRSLPWFGRRETDTSDSWEFTPREEASALFILQDDGTHLSRLRPDLVEHVRAFPGKESMPEGLEQALADAVNQAIAADPARFSRQRLEKGLPEYFGPARTSTGLLATDEAGGVKEVRRYPEGADRLKTDTPPAGTPGSGSGGEGTGVAPSSSGDGGDDPHADGGAVPAGLLARVEALVRRDEDISTALQQARRAEGDRDEALRLVENRDALLLQWQQALAEYGQTPEAVTGALDRAEEQARHAGQVLRGLMKGAGERLRALLGADGAAVTPPDDADGAAAQAGADAVTRQLELLSGRLEQLYRDRAARLYRTTSEEAHPDVSVPLVEQLDRIDRLEAEVGRLRATAPRSAAILLLVGALDEAGRTLASLGAEQSRLDGTDLSPATLAEALRDMGIAAEASWHRILLDTARDGAGDGSIELLHRFLAWLLANPQVQTLTQMLRLREVINAYFPGSGARDAETLYGHRREYERACDAVLLSLRAVGVYLDPISFLKPPPAGNGVRFESVGGQPTLVRIPALQELVVARVRGAARELSDTIADVSDWGYACPGLPFDGMPTRGWLCRGLGEL